MRSRPVEPETPLVKLEEVEEDFYPVCTPQDDEGKNRFEDRNVSGRCRYDFRTSIKSKNELNVSEKQEASVGDDASPQPSVKRRKRSSVVVEQRDPVPCDQKLAVDVSGRRRKRSKESGGGVLRSRKRQINSTAGDFLEISVCEADFCRVIDRRIQVYWKLDDEWYYGWVKRYDPTNKLHHVVYDDGDEEWVSLERDKFKLQLLPGDSFGQSNALSSENVRIQHPYVDRKESNYDDVVGSEKGNIRSRKRSYKTDVKPSKTDYLQKDRNRRKQFCTDVKQGRDRVINVSQKGDTRRKRAYLDLKQGKNGGIDDSAKGGIDVLPKGVIGDTDCAMTLFETFEEVNTPDRDEKNRVDSDLGESNVSAFCSEADYGSMAAQKATAESHNSLPRNNLACDKGSVNTYFRKRRRTLMSSTDNLGASSFFRGADDVCNSSMAVQKSTVEAGTSLPSSGAVCDKMPVNACFQKHQLNSANSMGDMGSSMEVRMFSAENGNTSLHNRLAIDKAPINAYFRKRHRKVSSSMADLGASNFCSGADAMNRRMAAQKGTVGTNVSAHKELIFDKASVNTYFRKRHRQPTIREIDGDAGKRIQSGNLENTSVSPKSNINLALPESVRICECLSSGKKLENSSSSNDIEMCNGHSQKVTEGGLSSSLLLELVPMPSLRKLKWSTNRASPKALVSPIHLKQPSQRPCIAPGVQLYERGLRNDRENHGADFEWAKALRTESLMLSPEPVLHFLCCGSELLNSSFCNRLQLQPFGAELLSSLDHIHLPLQECMKMITLCPDFHMEVLIVDSVSGLRQLCFWGSFQEVLTNCSASLASVLSPVGNQSSAMASGLQTPANLQAAVKSIRVWFSSPQGGMVRARVYNFENLEQTRYVQWSDLNSILKGLFFFSEQSLEEKSSNVRLGSLQNSIGDMGYLTTTLIPAGAFHKFHQNGLQWRFAENKRITSQLPFQNLIQRNCGMVKSFINQRKDAVGIIVKSHQSIPSFCLNFAAAPNLFMGLHMKLLLGNSIGRYYCGYHGSDSSDVENACLDINYSKAGRGECGKTILSALLPSLEVPTKKARTRHNSSHSPEMLSDERNFNTAVCSPAKRLKLEGNLSSRNSRLDWVAQPSAMSSDFDVNIARTSAGMRSMQNNTVPVLPVLKFRRSPTNSGSWHFAGITRPSSVNAETSIISGYEEGQISLFPRESERKAALSTNRLTSHSFGNLVESLQSSTNDSKAGQLDGHPEIMLVQDTFREWDMFRKSAVYSGSGEPSLSGWSHSTFENADDFSSKTERPMKRGRPPRQNKQEKLKESTMDSSKMGLEFDSISCTANILVAGSDTCWRECGAEVALESSSPNEWVLAIKLHGLTRFTHKAQEPKNRKTQEQKLHRANSYVRIWTGGPDWSLEFPDKNQWYIFRQMYEECDIRNLRASSSKNIPIPGVRELEDHDCCSVDIPFVRPSLMYIQHDEDEVNRLLFSSCVVYDMDSDDEEWLGEFNSSAAGEGSDRCNQVSEEAFERIMNMLEKTAFTQQCEALTVGEVAEICSNLGPKDVLIAVHGHWLKKRKKTGMALVRQFQTAPCKQLKQILQKPKRQHVPRNWANGVFHETRQQCNGMFAENKAVPGALVFYSDAVAKVQEAKTAACIAIERAAAKRSRAQRLMQNADLVTYKSVVASKIAETIQAIERATVLDAEVNTFSAQFPNDNRLMETGSAAEGSMGTTFRVLASC